MTEQPLLSDLCSICYTEARKYRCPRCQTQTCSLPCYKRHQQRASCNGKRDAAAFVKKSQWATAAGIDHDYNYLKRIERSIDKAGQDVSDRGIARSSAANKMVAKRDRAPNPLQKYLIENRITVQHAPKGMSRQKSNLTRATARHRIMWTVEWCDVEGRKEVQNDCLECSTIDELYAMLRTQKRNTEKRRTGVANAEISGQAATKRKKLLQTADLAQKTISFERNRQAFDDELTKQEANLAGEVCEIVLSSSDAKSTPECTSGQRNSHRGHTDEAEPSPHLESLNHPGHNQSSGRRPEQPAPEHSPNKESKGFYYLLKPGTTSALKVLIPLTPTSTLTAALKGRVVLEYPTIYLLDRPPDSLPRGFMLARECPKMERSEDAELDGMLHATGIASGRLGNARKQVQKSEELDSGSILDMLKRDVRV